MSRVSSGTEVRGMRLEVRKPRSLALPLLPDPRPETPDPFVSRPLSSSRVFDTRLSLSPLLVVLIQEPGRAASERRTWAQRAGTALLLSKDGSTILDEGPRTVLCSSNRYSPAKRNWHREAILACASRLAKAKPLLAAERSSRQKRSPYFQLAN